MSFPVDGYAPAFKAKVALAALKGDRRISETRITPKARAAVRAIRPVRHQVYTHATRGIELQHLNFVCEVIIKMIDNLGGHRSLFPPQ